MNLCSVCDSKCSRLAEYTHQYPDWIRYPGGKKIYFCSAFCFDLYTRDSKLQLAIEQRNAPQSHGTLAVPNQLDIHYQAYLKSASQRPKDAPREDCPACDGTGSSPCQYCQGTGHRAPNAPQPYMLSKEDIDLIESGLLCILDDNAAQPHTDAKAEGEHIKKVLGKLGCKKREYLERLYP